MGAARILSQYHPVAKPSEHAAFWRRGAGKSPARAAHVEALDVIIAKAMAEAKCSFDQIDWHRRRRRSRSDRRRHCRGWTTAKGPSRW